MEAMHADTKYYIACSAVPALRSTRFFRLMSLCSGAEQVWNASVTTLCQAGCERQTAEMIIAQRSAIDPDALVEKIFALGISVVTCEDEAYPLLLRQIPARPYVLYYQGKLPLHGMHCIGIVGTRRTTEYGVQATQHLVRDLTRAEFCIVSGLARGIDSLVHKGCLEAGGITVAVLGTGVDTMSIYPRMNRYLAGEIIERGGCVVSEYPPGTAVQAYHFPARNRIISGMSKGIIVVEAPQRSGALITARHALDQNRDIFAVPGSIYNPMSEGPNGLIKQGAIPVTSSLDICEHYEMKQQGTQQRIIMGENDAERLLLGILSHEPHTIDELCRMCHLDTKSVASTLLIMEVKRMVRNIGAMRYVKI